MKQKPFLLAVITAFLSLSLAPHPYQVVRYVVDGDTIILETGEPVRYLGIDAPEMEHDGEPNEFMALESRRLNHDTVNHNRVRLEFDQEKRDHHGRLLAYVFLQNGEMVNALLVKKGLARVLAVKPNLKYFHLLLESQRGAIKEKAGLWVKAPERPEPFYVGNPKSYRLHRPGCPLGKKISPASRIKFSDSLQAYWEGFSPCRRCRP
jgi:micrococcal nuclease